MLSALAAIDLKWDGRNAYADALDGLPLTRQVNALYHWLRWLQGSAETQLAFPSHAQLGEWAMQLFRPALTDRPHQAGGHDFVIRRRKNLLLLERKEGIYCPPRCCSVVKFNVFFHQVIKDSLNGN